MKKFPFVLSAVLLLALFSCEPAALTQDPASKETASTLSAVYTNPEEAAHLMEDTRYIIHAAGRLGLPGEDGALLPPSEETGYFDGANAMEGLVSSYEAGCRVIEMDFNFTSDGSLACVHDWYRQYSSAITDNVPLSLEEFLSCKIYDLYTPVWLGSLADFLKEHEDVYIVTDIKDRNIDGAAAIASYCPDLKNRFLIQIYNESEYDAVRELGFEYIIYTLYQLDWNSKTDTKALADFAADHPLIAYTFSYELCLVEGYLDGMKKTGVPLFIHTVNDPEEQNVYFAAGIRAIYTDIPLA